MKTEILRTSASFLTLLLAILFVSALHAQEILSTHKSAALRIDTTLVESPMESTVVETNLEPMQVVTNKFGKNWFLLATGGVHSFRGDYSKTGDFGGTLSPEFGIGVGKWFTPGIGLKAEVVRSSSKGYTEYLTGHYGYGDVLQNSDSVSYRKMKTTWTNIGASVMLNLTRMIFGYEGYLSPHHKNQFLINLGVGMALRGAQDNILSAHAELQYSRYFTRTKRFSLDFKMRAFFYESNFDLEYGQADHSAKKVDLNIGPQIGLTYNLGSLKKSAWKQAYTEIYRRDFRERQIIVEHGSPSSIEYGTLTFYVFFPNNYSGRNDAPQVKGATVNAIDYLANGIYTQKRFVDNGSVASRLVSGTSLKNLPVVDVATEGSDALPVGSSISRGYELDSLKLSLDTDEKHMADFREEYGYYYAPIYDGDNTWHYRVDNVALGQKLLDSENYKETQSFGLNAHYGLEIVRRRMEVSPSDFLVSFADVYAAMNSYSGYTAQFSDSATVSHVKEILDKAYISVIQAEGLSTSQDNYNGSNAATITTGRNAALSRNRAQTVIEWLKSHPRLCKVSSQTFQINLLKNGISTVTDTSVRGLDAKLNRCTKISVHYMLKREE